MLWLQVPLNNPMSDSSHARHHAAAKYSRTLMDLILLMYIYKDEGVTIWSLAVALHDMTGSVAAD